MCNNINSTYSFNLHFPEGLWCWTLFHMFICHQYVLFRQVSMKVFCPYSNWIVCFLTVKRVLFVFCIQVHYQINDWKIFSLSLWLAFSSFLAGILRKNFLFLIKGNINFVSSLVQGRNGGPGSMHRLHQRGAPPYYWRTAFVMDWHHSHASPQPICWTPNPQWLYLEIGPWKR